MQRLHWKRLNGLYKVKTKINQPFFSLENSLLSLKGFESLHSELIIKLQYFLQHKDLRRLLLCQGKCKAACVTTFACWHPCVHVHVCACVFVHACMCVCVYACIWIFFFNPIKLLWSDMSFYSPLIQVKTLQSKLQGLILQPFNH